MGTWTNAQKTIQQLIDIMDEVVIVEFGSNKNCRIPMKKEAIVEIEKAAKN